MPIYRLIFLVKNNVPLFNKILIDIFNFFYKVKLYNLSSKNNFLEKFVSKDKIFILFLKSRKKSLGKLVEVLS